MRIRIAFVNCEKEWILCQWKVGSRQRDVLESSATTDSLSDSCIENAHELQNANAAECQNTKVGESTSEPIDTSNQPLLHASICDLGYTALDEPAESCCVGVGIRSYALD